MLFPAAFRPHRPRQHEKLREKSSRACIVPIWSALCFKLDPSSDFTMGLQLSLKWIPLFKQSEQQPSWQTPLDLQRATQRLLFPRLFEIVYFRCLWPSPTLSLLVWSVFFSSGLNALLSLKPHNRSWFLSQKQHSCVQVWQAIGVCVRWGVCGLRTVWWLEDPLNTIVVWLLQPNPSHTYCVTTTGASRDPIPPPMDSLIILPCKHQHTH